MDGPPVSVTVDDLQAAGLYDPAAEHADERLALLQFLVGLGASFEDLVSSRDAGLALARANADAVALLPAAAGFLDVLLRRHIEAARRPLALLHPGTHYETQHLTIGLLIWWARLP